MPQLYRLIDLSDVLETGESSEPVQYVGCYVLQWHKGGHPTVGFVPVDAGYVDKEVARLRTELDRIASYPALLELDPPAALDDMRRIARKAIIGEEA
jgi:hypothetical protein